jgi:hypothetical protein
MKKTAAGAGGPSASTTYRYSIKPVTISPKPAMVTLPTLPSPTVTQHVYQLSPGGVGARHLGSVDAKGIGHPRNPRLDIPMPKCCPICGAVPVHDYLADAYHSLSCVKTGRWGHTVHVRAKTLRTCIRTWNRRRP